MDQSCEGFATVSKGREKLASTMDFPHTKTVEEVFEHFKVTEEDGLNPQMVTELREKYGLNGALLLHWQHV